MSEGSIEYLLDSSSRSDILTCMMVGRSQAQPELTHVLLTDKDAEAVVSALRGTKNETAKALRKKLRKVLRERSL